MTSQAIRPPSYLFFSSGGSPLSSSPCAFWYRWISATWRTNSSMRSRGIPSKPCSCPLRSFSWGCFFSSDMIHHTAWQQKHRGKCYMPRTKHDTAQIGRCPHGAVAFRPGTCQAEGTGLEPATPFGAPHLQCGCSPIRIPSERRGERFPTRHLILYVCRISPRRPPVNYLARGL